MDLNNIIICKLVGTLRARFLPVCMICLGACSGDSIWKQEVTANIGNKSDIIKCAPAALEAVSDMLVDRKEILYQYGIVQFDMTIKNKGKIHGDVSRVSPTTARIAFYGRQEDEPLEMRDQIASKLNDLRAAIQKSCSF